MGIFRKPQRPVSVCQLHSNRECRSVEGEFRLFSRIHHAIGVVDWRGSARGNAERQVSPGEGRRCVTEFAVDKLTGNLAEIGTTSFRGGACARQSACLPYGIQISKDNKLAVFASFALNARRENEIPLMLTAQITSQGLVNPVLALHLPQYALGRRR